MIAATLTTALALTPLYLHRLFARLGEKATLMVYGHRLISCALVGLMAVMVGTVLLIFDVANRLNAGTIAAIVVLAAIPTRHIRRIGPDHDRSPADRGTGARCCE